MNKGIFVFMTNTIQSSVIVNKNPFSDVSKRTSERDYWLGEKDNTKSIAGMELPEILTPEEARRTRNTTKIGTSIAAATLIVGGVIFLLMRGGPKSFSKNIVRFSKNIEKQLEQSKLNLENNGLYNKFLQAFLKVADFAQKRIDTANNFTTIKDVTFEKFMNNRLTGKITGKIHSFITKMFARVARRAVKLQYEETYEKLQTSSKLNKKLLSKIADKNEIVEIDGIKKTKAEWIEQLSQTEEEIFATYEKHFGKNAQLSRLKNFTEVLQNLKQQFKEKKAFWFFSKDIVKNFVADSYVKDARIELQKNTNSIRKIFSHSESDLVQECNENIFQITKLLGINDTKNLKTLRNISKNISELSKSSDKQKIEEEITKFITDVMTSPKIKPEISDELYNYAQAISSNINSFKQGKVEDILNICQKLLPPKDYEKLQRMYKGNIVALDKSIHLETEDYYNKLRDLTLGSAPTDILSVVAGLFTLGYYLTKSEKGRERNEIALKYGLPALTGLGAMVYGNAKLLAGTKALTLSLITMFITNRLGDIANKLLENYYQKQTQPESINNL